MLNHSRNLLIFRDPTTVNNIGNVIYMTEHCMGFDWLFVWQIYAMTKTVQEEKKHADIKIKQKMQIAKGMTLLLHRCLSLVPQMLHVSCKQEAKPGSFGLIRNT